MTLAYNIVRGTHLDRLEPTNLYVRFLPANASQLYTLIDSLDLDLFDTPMDYSIIQDGDYYQDPSIPAEQITWQYAVVPTNFQFPAEISHQILDSIYIPSNFNLDIEDTAFQLLGNPDIDDPPSIPMSVATGIIPYSASSPSSVVSPNVTKCPPGWEWSPTAKKCLRPLPGGCPPGYVWDEDLETCVVYLPPPPPIQPGPGSHYPAGHLYVHDTEFNDDKPLRNVRVVAKRWFKVTRLYTNDNGYFESSRRFHKKAKIIVKFKNTDAIVKCVRGVRVWQACFPVRVKLGVWSGTLNDITHTFFRNADPDSKGTRYWAAATVNNAVQEYNDLASQFHIGTPPSSRLNIVITNWGSFSASAATPMYAQYRGNATLDDMDHYIQNFAVITPFQSLVAGGVRALSKVFFGHADIIFGYNSDLYVHSDKVKETLYHELTHAAHYVKVGGPWWGAFRMALIGEVISGNDDPYGDGTSSINSPIIALAESWAYHIGYEMADMKYALNSSDFYENGGRLFQTDAAISSYAHFLEEFDPNRSEDPFRWIPKGLFHDLIDTVNETDGTGSVNDLVSGYTDQQFYDALDNDVYDLNDFRQNLLQENGNSQSVQVNNLFNEYGY